MERDAEGRRLLLVGDGRLDGLRPADDRDVVAAPRAGRRTSSARDLGGQARHERRADVQQLDRHRVAVCEPQSLRRDDRLRRGDMQDATEACAGGNRAKLERAAPRYEPRFRMSSLNEVDVGALGDLRLRDERARTTSAHQVALAHQLVERCADRQSRDTEVDAELPLGRDRVADSERLDQLEHALAGLALLRQRAARAGAPAVSRRAPLSGSKKWKPAGSTRRLPADGARSTRRACARGVPGAQTWCRHVRRGAEGRQGHRHHVVQRRHAHPRPHARQPHPRPARDRRRRPARPHPARLPVGGGRRGEAPAACRRRADGDRAVARALVARAGHDRPRPRGALVLRAARGPVRRLEIAGGTQLVEPTVTNDEESASSASRSTHLPCSSNGSLARPTGDVIEFTSSTYRGDRYRLVTELGVGGGRLPSRSRRSPASR